MKLLLSEFDLRIVQTFMSMYMCFPIGPESFLCIGKKSKLVYIFIQLSRIHKTSFISAYFRHNCECLEYLFILETSLRD
jgi:hypothetical protein